MNANSAAGWTVTRLALAADWVDRRLPGRHRGRIRNRSVARGAIDDPRFRSREQFFATAEARGMTYATLGGQNDDARLVVLFSDSDVEAARDLVAPWPVGEAIELYSPSGLWGSPTETCQSCLRRWPTACLRAWGRRGQCAWQEQKTVFCSAFTGMCIWQALDPGFLQSTWKKMWLLIQLAALASPLSRRLWACRLMPR